MVEPSFEPRQAGARVCALTHQGLSAAPEAQHPRLRWLRASQRGKSGSREPCVQTRKPRPHGILHCAQCLGSAMSGLDPGHGEPSPFPQPPEQAHGGARGASQSQGASLKRGRMSDLGGKNMPPNLKGLGSGMCFCCVWQDPGAAVREPGQEKGSYLLPQKCENRASLGLPPRARGQLSRALPGNARLLPGVKVTFCRTRNESAEPGAPEPLGHQPHVGAHEEGAGQIQPL